MTVKDVSPQPSLFLSLKLSLDPDAFIHLPIYIVMGVTKRTPSILVLFFVNFCSFTILS